MATRLLGAKLNLLSVRDVLNARDKELSDGGGLLLRCAGPSAAWVFRYTSATGKRREMGLGACARHNARAAGESLALARDLATKQRALLAAVPPLDPIDERNKANDARREAARKRKAEKQQEKATLDRVARVYHEKFIEPKRHPKRSADWFNSLENHVPVALWHKPIAEVTRAELLEFLRDIQGHTADTGQQVRRRLDEVFEEAVEQGTVSVNLVALLQAKLRREHKPKRVTTHEALAFAAAPAFVEGLRTQPGIAARSPFAFPSILDKTRPLSNMAMLALLKRMKRTDITVHGFRASFSTWANETAAARPDVIEACLAHRKGDKIRAAYNRAQFAGERRKLLNAWGAYLEGR